MYTESKRFAPRPGARFGPGGEAACCLSARGVPRQLRGGCEPRARFEGGLRLEEGLQPGPGRTIPCQRRGCGQPCDTHSCTDTDAQSDECTPESPGQGPTSSLRAEGRRALARAVPRRELPSGVPDPEQGPRVALREEKAATHGAPGWLHGRQAPPFSREEVRDAVGNRANGTDLPPGLGPLTFLLRKMLTASRSRLSPGTRNSWHFRPGPPRPEEAPWRGRGTMGHCAARGLPDRKPGPAEPSDSDPAALGPHV